MTSTIEVVKIKCSVCGEGKSVDQFPRNGYFPDGTVRRRPDCYTCYNISRKTNSKKGKRHFKKFMNNTKHRTGELDTMTLEQWRECLVWFGGVCAFCGAESKRGNPLTKEHVLAVAKGGTTVVGNIVPSCGRCNSSKCDSDMEPWYRSRKWFSEARLLRVREWVRKNGL